MVYMVMWGSFLTVKAVPPFIFPGRFRSGQNDTLQLRPARKVSEVCVKTEPHLHAALAAAC
jgi:hypothetical protein